MKIRNGFVSNSSSSNFIVAVRKSEACQHCGRSDPDFLQLVDRAEDYESELSAMGHQKVLGEMRTRLKEFDISPDTNLDALKDSLPRDVLRAFRQLQDQDWSGWELA